MATARVEDVCKLLDNGWTVTLFRNDLGSITATATHANRKDVNTDDFTVAEVLYRITEKATTGRIV